MTEGGLARIGALVSAAWAGEMLAIGGIAAPAAFATLPHAGAGLVAGRLFGVDATVAVLVGALLAMVALQLARQRSDRGAGSRVSAELLLVLGAIATVIAGHYAVQPMLQTARSGVGPLSFGALHAVSTGFFALRFVLVTALAWRFGRPVRSLAPPS